MTGSPVKITKFGTLSQPSQNNVLKANWFWTQIST